jgi:hypothetical protein
MLLGIVFNACHSFYCGVILWLFSMWFIAPLVEPYDDFHMPFVIAIGIAFGLKVFTYHAYQVITERKVMDYLLHNFLHPTLYLVLGTIIKLLFLR